MELSDSSFVDQALELLVVTRKAERWMKLQLARHSF